MSFFRERMSMRSLIRLCLLASVLTLVQGALSATRAQEPDSLLSMSLGDLLDLRVVETASRFHESLLNAPSSVSIVTADDLRYWGYRSVADVLAGEVGFHTANDRIFTYVGAGGISVPGDWNSRILLLIDGQRANENFYGQAFLDTGFPVPVEVIERIEIVRGPGSALYGTAAMLAVVNVLTVEPGARRLRVGGRAGDQGVTHGWLEVGHGSEDGAHWTLAASHSRSDGREDLYYPVFDAADTNNGVYSANDSEVATKVFGKLGFGPVTLGGYWSSRDKDNPTASYGTIFNDPRSRQRDEHLHVGLSLRPDIGPRWEASTALSFDRFGSRGDYPYDYPPVTINRDKVDVHSVALEQSVTYASTRSTATLGAYVRHDYDFLGLNFDEEPYASYVDYGGSRTIFATFAEGEHRPVPRLSVRVGGRFDHYLDQGSSFNPRIAAVYSVSERGRLKLLVGRAFRAPTTSQLEDAGPWRDDLGVGPESIWTRELLWSQLLRPDVNLVVSVFSNELDGLIVFGEGPSGGTGYYNREGKIQSNGLRGGLTVRTEVGWRANLGYTFVDPGESRMLATNAPRHVFQMRAVTPPSRRGFTLAARARTLSERLTPAETLAAGYTTLDLTVGWTPPSVPGLRLAGSIYNAFDEAYADPSAPFHRQPVIPQDGRTVRIEASWSGGGQ